MALIVADRVLETSTTTGTGAYTLTGAQIGYRTASSVCVNADTFTYYAEDVDTNGNPAGNWETGLGTWSTGNILTRTTIYASSNAGSPVSWGPGTKRIGLALNATAALASLTVVGNISTGANLTFTGPGNRITGDMTNSTLANRVMFQTNSLNNPTTVSAIPNAAGTQSTFAAYNISDTVNSPRGELVCNNTEVRIQAVKSGTGAYLPVRIFTSGTERLHVADTGRMIHSSNFDKFGLQLNNSKAAANGHTIGGDADGSFCISDSAGTERMRIDTSGTITIPGAVTASEVSITGGAFGAGKLYTTAAGGMVLTGKTGSANDLMMLTPAGGSIAYVPTGTTSLNFSNTIIGTGANFSGATETGSLTFKGAGSRITGDFSNATFANRPLFQTSALNGNTGIGLLPNGTAQNTSISLFTAADPANASRLQIKADQDVAVTLVSDYFGTGSYLPMTFVAGATERLRIETGGNVGIGTSAPAGGGGGTALQVHGAAASSFRLSAGSGVLDLFNLGTDAYIQTTTAIPIIFRTNVTERMRIDGAGQIGIGGPPKAWTSDKKAIEFPNANSSLWSHETNKAISLSANYYFSAAGKTTIATGLTSEAQVLPSGIYLRTYASSTAGALIPTTPTASFVVDSVGNALLATSTGGLGYGTGGTVTQATSKNTTVTLNKPCGQITMSAAALAGNTTIAFIFNNSILGAYDVIQVSVVAPTTSNYIAWQTANGVGVAAIAVRNLTAGSLSEAVVLNFSIIKGAGS